MGGSCGVAIDMGTVWISYRKNGRWIADSIDSEGAEWLLSSKLVDCGPFDDVVLTGRDTDVVDALLRSLDTGGASTVRTVDESSALLAYARSIDMLASARSLLVLDLGRNGTSAFTLDVLQDKVLRSVRRTLLSGTGLDAVVEKIVMDKKILPPPDTIEAQDAYRKFYGELKELVSTSQGVRAPDDGPMLITREEFEEAITPSVLQLLAWAAPTDPDAVLLVGGGARIPLVRALVEQEWEIPLLLPDSPTSVIAEGAALEAVPRRPEMDISGLLSESQLHPTVFEESAPTEPQSDRSEEPAVDDEIHLPPGSEAETERMAVVARPDSSSLVSDPVPLPSSDPVPLPSSPMPVEDENGAIPDRSVAAGRDAGHAGQHVIDAGRRVVGVIRAAPALSAVIVVILLLFAVVFVPVRSEPTENPVVVPEVAPTVDAGPGTAPIQPIPEEMGPLPEADGPVDAADLPAPTEDSGFVDEVYPEVGFGSGTGLDVGN